MKKLPIVISICVASLLALATVLTVTLVSCNNKQADVEAYDTVSFKNDDGSLLSKSKVNASETAVYQEKTSFANDGWAAQFTTVFSTRCFLC